MLQLCWNPLHSTAELLDLPLPEPGEGQLAIANAFSVISSGTERSGTQLSLSSPRALWRARPDLRQRLRQIIGREGVLRAAVMVRDRLGALQPVGYSCAGIVQDIGSAPAPFAIGDRVACSGAGYAVHAERVLVPFNLCARVPEGCDLEAAAFAGVGAIALHAFRLSKADLGGRVLVIGLGLLGQIAARLALAAGCDVAGIDPLPERIERLRPFGLRQGWSPDCAPPDGDFDCAILAAAAPTAAPLETAARLLRERGRMVALGLFPLALARDLFYRKEIEFIVSRSTGPGRYDPHYEELGLDYPAGYVRWTQQRNLESFLALIAAGKISLADMITHRFPIADGVAAYRQLRQPAPDQLALVLQYPAAQPDAAQTAISTSVSPKLSAGSLRTAPANVKPNSAPSTASAPACASRGSAPRIAVIGAGSFCRGVLLPALQKLGARPAAICSRRPLQAQDAARRFRIGQVSAEPRALIESPDFDAIVIATRHDTHAELAALALDAGKLVFLEKPLALTRRELDHVAQAMSRHPGRMLVGYNRRFAPLAVRARSHFRGHEPGLMMTYRINAGSIPANHWTQTPEIGGGRLVGEACHFIDWLAFLSGSLPCEVFAAANRHTPTADDVAITLLMENGAVGTVLYTAAGGPSLPKEHIEVFAGGRTLVIDDWRVGYFGAGARRRKSKLAGKGHHEEMEAFLAALRGKTPMPIEDAALLRGAEATFAAQLSITRQAPVRLPLPAAESGVESAQPADSAAMAQHSN